MPFGSMAPNMGTGLGPQGLSLLQMALQQQRKNPNATGILGLPTTLGGPNGMLSGLMGRLGGQPQQPGMPLSLDPTGGAAPLADGNGGGLSALGGGLSGLW